MNTKPAILLGTLVAVLPSAGCPREPAIPDGVYRGVVTGSYAYTADSQVLDVGSMIQETSVEFRGGVPVTPETESLDLGVMTLVYTVRDIAAWGTEVVVSFNAEMGFDYGEELGTLTLTGVGTDSYVLRADGALSYEASGLLCSDWIEDLFGFVCVEMAASGTLYP
jgi:hypothetical protein